MDSIMDIQFYNRYTGQIETEIIYGEKWLRRTYESPLGKMALWAFVKRHWFSTYYGKKMDDPKSREKIIPFLRDYQLDPNDYKKSPNEFTSFNDFFYREIKTEKRPIDTNSDTVVFPADGRHFGYQSFSEQDSIFTKGSRFTLTDLIQDDNLTNKFLGRSMIISRLCPVDYHRYHFAVNGIPKPPRDIKGDLYSVSPIALRRNINYLVQNKRTITEIETENCGTVLQIEIGATCVGTIIQTFEPEKPVKKGDQKGYFRFGGSCTITLFEPNRVQLDKDLLDATQKQIELYAHMGDHCAKII